MPSLPKHILTALKNNKTSLGDHPSFPPEEEEKFIVGLVESTFEKLSEKAPDTDYETLKKELGRILGECKKLEANNKGALEELCANIINNLFSIPQDTIQIISKLVDNVDVSTERMLPEKTVDFSFDDINDMNNLTDEIYKRRLLNALVVGASMFYTNNIGEYVRELFEIDSDLPALYKKALTYNTMLMFLEKDSFNEKGSTNGGKVDVTISSDDTYPSIKAEGLLFPILVEETIKGILELAISHGLPENSDKAKYVMSKSDFKLAELWDMRLGYCLWSLIETQIKKCGYELTEIGINFFLMELAEMPCEIFNKSLMEIFARTRKGEEIITDICESIVHDKEQDEFDDYIQSKNDELIQINDNDGYFTSEELINDSYDITECKKKTLDESEWNYHFSKTKSEHDLKPYGSDNKYAMLGRETGHFGSGTYFSTYKQYGLDGKYENNPDPNFIQIDDNVYRVDFDLYSNLYRVKSKKQGDILYTMLYTLNRFFNKINTMGDFEPKQARYDNSELYQKIKANADGLGLKCPTYYELTRMAQRHNGKQSFSTLFMEYNGFNGVNVSGVEYYDNTKHGSVIYDLSKTQGKMEEIKPKETYTGFKNSAYNDTFVENHDDLNILALKGDTRFFDDLPELNFNQQLRLLKNYTMSGNFVPFYVLGKLGVNVQKRYLKIVYSAIMNKWGNYEEIFYSIFQYENRQRLSKLINETNSLYWVNLHNDKEGKSYLIELLKEYSYSLWDNDSDANENNMKKEYLNTLSNYMNRELTDYEKRYIENDYYEDD